MEIIIDPKPFCSWIGCPSKVAGGEKFCHPHWGKVLSMQLEQTPRRVTR